MKTIISAVSFKTNENETHLNLTPNSGWKIEFDKNRNLIIIFSPEGKAVMSIPLTKEGIGNGTITIGEAEYYVYIDEEGVLHITLKEEPKSTRNS